MHKPGCNQPARLKGIETSDFSPQPVLIARELQPTSPLKGH
jgi:hypothetical protein